jgi:hypothetical protein
VKVGGPIDADAAHRGDSPCHDPQALGRLASALAELDAIERRARPVELALAIQQVARCHVDLCMPEAAEWYYQRALAWARTLGSPATLIEILCELADTDVLLAQESSDESRRYALRERARDQVYEAATLAARTADRRCEASTLFQASQVLSRCGDHGDACALRERAARLIDAPDPTFAPT